MYMTALTSVLLLLVVSGCASKNQPRSAEATRVEPEPQLRLSWAPPAARSDGTTATDIAGYKIYYGQASRKYSFVATTGNQTSYGVVGLIPERLYYFAIAAYDSAGTESSLSDEIQAMAPRTARSTPTLLLEAPVRGQQGECWVTGVSAGEEVSLLVSATGEGSGPCSPQLGGLCVDIFDPQTLGTGVADASGIVIFLWTPPPDTPPGQTVSFQAVLLRGMSGIASVKTNVITARVVD